MTAKENKPDSTPTLTVDGGDPTQVVVVLEQEGAVITIRMNRSNAKIIGEAIANGEAIRRQFNAPYSATPRESPSTVPPA